MRSAQATLGAADIRGRYGLASAELRAQGRDGDGSSDGGTRRSTAGEKPTAKQKEFANEFSNCLEKVKQDLSKEGGYGEEDTSIGELTDLLQNEGKKVLSPEEYPVAYAYVAAAQGMQQKQQGDDDAAARMWQQVPRHVLEEIFPDYDFSDYSDW